MITHYMTYQLIVLEVFFSKTFNINLACLNMEPFNCRTQACCAACEWYYRDVMAVVLGIIMLLALLSLVSLAPATIGRLRRDAVVDGTWQLDID